MAVISVKIEGMTCGGCVKGLEAAFAREAAITSSRIDLKSKLGVFEGDVDPQTIVAIIEEQGFEAQVLPS